MAYSENHKKFVAVLSTEHPLPRMLNSICHATAGLAQKLTKDEAEYLEYQNAADSFIAAVSRYPFVILQAKNSSQIAALRRAATEAGIEHNVFISAMIGQSAEEQMARTRAASGDDLNYVAIALFGQAAALDPLTKRFSLFKAPFPVREN